MKNYIKHSNYLSFISEEGRKRKHGLCICHNYELENLLNIRALKIRIGYEGKL